ncbi:MAG: 7-cyano-7-deazaguanine synthase QueC [Planctomycetota bacterium]
MSDAAVVLLSGGLDSATVLAIARDRGLACHCLSFDYGQRHRVELEAAAAIVTSLGASSHTIFPLATAVFGGSSLTDGPEVAKGRTNEEIGEGIPETYVPARNLVFLSIGIALAESLGCVEVHAGVNALDYSGYPDCRPEFIDAFGNAARLATKVGVERGGIRVVTPLISMTKAEIIQAGAALGLDYGLTTSCYDPADRGACGACDSCQLRRAGFEAAGVADPTRYAP